MTDKTTPTLSVVIPAAGLSSRLGQAKQQIAFGNSTLLGHSINTARRFVRETLSSQAPLPIVICNPDQSSQPPSDLLENVRLLINETPEHGILSSLRCAQEATANDDAVLVLLGDQYRVSSEALTELFERWLESPEQPIAAQYQPLADAMLRRAHVDSTETPRIDDVMLAPPMIWPRAYWHELLKSHHPRAGQTLLHNSRARALAMPEAAYDIDTETDVYLLQHWLQHRSDTLH